MSMKTDDPNLARVNIAHGDGFVLFQCTAAAIVSKEIRSFHDPAECQSSDQGIHGHCLLRYVSDPVRSRLRWSEIKTKIDMVSVLVCDLRRDGNVGKGTEHRSVASMTKA